MAAYVVVQIEVEDAVGYERYKAMVQPTIALHGGRYLARGGRVETLEGSWLPPRLVILEFPSLENARSWWASPAYAEAKALRQATSRTEMIVVEGVEDGRPRTD
jgi:uncharacterized protein (DUF1330 family)